MFRRKYPQKNATSDSKLGGLSEETGRLCVSRAVGNAPKDSDFLDREKNLKCWRTLQFGTRPVSVNRCGTEAKPQLIPIQMAFMSSTLTPEASTSLGRGFAVFTANLGHCEPTACASSESPTTVHRLPAELGNRVSPAPVAR